MITKSRTILAGLVVAAAAVTAARAHHSFTATYFEDRTIEIEGRLVQFMFRNPHSFVHVQAPDENGEMQRWAVEWGGAGQLSSQGVTSQTLRPGDVVTITGNPGRDAGDYRLLLVHLLRDSDGFSWGDGPGESFD